MARNGKIARLPLAVRTELNRRLQDGEPGNKLVEWLNRLKPVRDILKEEFGGRAVTEQNLSEWRQGGYEEWLRHEESRGFIETMSEQSGELDEAAGGELISDRFGSVLAAELARIAQKFLEQETDLEKRWEKLKEIHHEFSKLRRDDHRSVRVRVKRAQWEWQAEREEMAEERADMKERREMASRSWGRQCLDLAKMLGEQQPAAGVRAGRATDKPGVKATRETHASNGSRGRSPHQPQAGGQPIGGEPAKLVVPNPSESDLIKPNPTKKAVCDESEPERHQGCPESGGDGKSKGGDDGEKGTNSTG